MATSEITIRVPSLAAGSVRQFVKLVLAGSLHERQEHLGHTYTAADGRPYTVFRETTCGTVGLDRTVIEVGFRLKLLRHSRLAHWVFQRVCILTTPFWSGFKGFAVKLWMVDQDSKNYLGIYQWGPEHDASVYVAALEKVLVPLSVRGSVWSRFYPGASLESFLNGRAIGKEAANV